MIPPIQRDLFIPFAFKNFSIYPNLFNYVCIIYRYRSINVWSPESLLSSKFQSLHH